MFVGMEDDSKYWREKLEVLEKGKNIIVEGSSQGVYAAIRTNPETFKNKEFSVRTDKKPTLKEGIPVHIKRVIRIK